MSTTSISATQTAKNLQKISKVIPIAAVILGSGIEALNNLTNTKTYSYQEIFGISPSIKGHSGSFELGQLDNKLVVVLRGRFHLYEGFDFDIVTLPTTALAFWGIPNLYLTNAAGGLNVNLAIGDLMLITGYRDHLNPRWKKLGTLPAVLTPITNCQNKLSADILSISQQLSAKDHTFCSLKQGVYAGVLGPCYETLAEIEMFKRLGADAVGMSTIPELEAAKELNIQAVAISVITNSWSEAKIHGHEEVVQAAKAASARLDKILQAAIRNQELAQLC